VLEGKTGTGKTHMVRALLGALQGAATVLLVPEHLVANLAEPAIVPVMVGLARMGKPLILVLEDCDDCLLSREHTTAQGDRANVATLSAVLNLADGILGAALNLRLVATTNARVEHMDSALLRPGRLIERIEVGPLPRRIALGVIAREAGLSATPDTLDTLDNGLTAGGLHGASITLAEAYEAARHIVARRAAQAPANTNTTGTVAANDTTAQA
jgi:ATP-dependent 26S proteasome regulatory subunit